MKGRVFPQKRHGAPVQIRRAEAVPCKELILCQKETLKS